MTTELMATIHARLLRAIDRQTRTSSFVGTLLSRVPISALFLIAYPIVELARARRRSLEQFAEVDGSAMVQIAFTALAGFWLLAHLKEIGLWSRRVLSSRPVVYFVAYLILAGVSTMWSTHPALTLYRCLEACVYLGLIIHVVSSARDTEHGLWLLIVYSAVASAALLVRVVRYRMLAGEPIGLVFSENIGPAIAAVGMFLCVAFRTRRWFYPCFCFFVAGVIMMSSAATYIAILVATLLMVAFRTSAKIRGVAFIIIGAICLAAFYCGPTTLLMRTIMFNKPPEAVETCTGRLGIWEWYWENAFKQNPCLGQGYEAGEHQARETGFDIPNAHNVFVAAAVGLGVPGLLLTLLLAGSMIYWAACIRGIQGTVLLGASICVWINALSIPSISSKVLPSWTAMAWLCILITAFRKRCMGSNTSGICSG